MDNANQQSLKVHGQTDYTAPPFMFIDFPYSWPEFPAILKLLETSLSDRIHGPRSARHHCVRSVTGLE